MHPGLCLYEIANLLPGTVGKKRNSFAVEMTSAAELARPLIKQEHPLQPADRTEGKPELCNCIL